MATGNWKKLFYVLLSVVVIILLVRTWGGESPEDEYYSNLVNLPEMQVFDFDAGKVLGDEGMKTISFEPVEVMPGLILERTIAVSESDGLEWNLVFESNAFDGEYIHIENIPKSFASDVSQIEFSIEPDEIIDPDPSVAWIINLETGFKMNIVLNVGIDDFVGKEVDLITVAENFDDIRILVGLEKCRLVENNDERMLCMIDLIGKNPEKFTPEHCKGISDSKFRSRERRACEAFLNKDVGECQKIDEDKLTDEETIVDKEYCKNFAFLAGYASCLGEVTQMQKDNCTARQAVWADFVAGCERISNVLPYQKCMAQITQEDEYCNILIDEKNGNGEHKACCQVIEEESQRDRCLEYVLEEKELEKGKSSIGEFNCPIPAGAEHIVKKLISADYWQKDGKKVGPSSTMYDEQKVFNCFNINGEQHGIQKSWYENGTFHTERNYKDGKQDGLQKSWHEDGTLMSEYNYKDGKQHGVQKEWNESGKLLKDCNYKDGKIHGKCMTWRGEGIYENGVEIEYESSLVDQSVEYKGFK